MTETAGAPNVDAGRMARVVLLVPPNPEGYVRDTYYGCWHKRKFVQYSWPPLMLYYLHALLPESIVLDAPAHNLDEEETLRRISSLGPDVVVTSVGTFTLKEDAQFLARLKGEYGCTTALFGELPTTNPEAAQQVSDIVIRGEPEAAIPALVRLLQQREPRGTIDAGLVKRIDALPFPRRRLEHRGLYRNPFAKRGPSTTLIASRGCVFGCVFCTVPALSGRTVRRRSVRNVIAELALLREQGFKEVFFRDENLASDRGFVTALCEGMAAEGLDIAWMANSRVDAVDERLLGLMREAGCHLLKFGVESFSDRTLRMLNKGTTVEDVRRAFSLCDRAGVGTVAHLMLGNPGEDERQTEQNIKELIRLDPTYASFDVVLTYPGTRLAEMASEGKGTDIPKERLEQLHDAAFRRFYMRPRTLARHLLALDSPGELLQKTVSTVQLWKGLLGRHQ